MRSYFVDLPDGRKLNVVHYPAATSTPSAGSKTLSEPVKVLALHGWLDSADSFKPLAPFLQAAGIELVCADLAGHGDSSPRGGNNPYLIVNDLADILVLVDTLGWQRFSMLGHSRGASISALFTAALPERVMALGLIDRLWPELQPAENTIGQIRATLLQSTPQNRPYPSFEMMLAARLRHGLGISEEAARILLERNVEQRADGWYWRYDAMHKQKSMLMMSDEQGADILARLAVPTSLVVATQGLALMMPDYAERLAPHPHIQWQLLEGRHHLHMDTQVDYLAAHYVNFFIEHADPA